MAAEGGVDYGDERTPLLKNTDDQDDGDADERGNETTGFEPGASSTPAPNGNQRQTTMNRPGEQPSFVEFPDVLGMSTTDAVMDVVVKEFPFVEKTKVFAFIENDSVKVAFIDRGKKGKPYNLFSKIPNTNEYKINEKVKKLVGLSNALGKGRRETIQEKMKMLLVGINDNKAVAEDPSVSQTERNKAREREKRQREELTALKRELDQLKKGNYSLPSESIELEVFQKNDEIWQERLQEIQRGKKEQDEIINNKNSTPAEIESSTEIKNELEREENEIINEREREIEQLPLGDRLREKVKAIFKKYGFTVTAVLLAVGTTLGVILSSLSNGLKGVAKGVGNGLKTLGKKIAQILLGLLGAVVSFVFRTAGNVVSFLGKHAWLLILAVAAFLTERVMKRRD